MTSIITLMTDFGTRDGFVAQMKGVILGISPDVHIVDVTHEIEPYQVLAGALVLKGFVRSFPPGSIHIGVVDPGVGSRRRGIALKTRDHILVGPDNGLFSLVLESQESWTMREIANPEFMLEHPHATFHGRDLFAPCAARLADGAAFADVGPPVQDPVRLELPVVQGTSDGIEGTVIYTDRFGTLVTNIPATLLTRTVQAVRVGNAHMMGLHEYFAEVEMGRPLALINSSGLLEVAVNRGSAEEFFGLEPGARVKVFWE